MKNILITGANGQLGLKIKDVAKSGTNNKFIFTDVAELNITDFSEVEKFVKNSKIDLLVNCAAYTSVDLAEDETDKAYLLNTYAPENLAMLSKKYNFKFIHISTDYVFDGNAFTPYSEEDKTNPTSVYGKSKLEGEIKVIEQNSEAIIIRTSWLYSEYGKNFAKTILSLAKEKDTLKVVYDQIGTPTYAGNLAQAINTIINRYFEKHVWHSGIYNYSNLGVCSWFDFATTLLKITKNDTKILPVLSGEFPAKAKRPHYSVLNKSKIINTYNINIPYWTDACAEMVKNYVC